MGEWQSMESAPAAPKLGDGYVFFLVWNGKEVVPAARDFKGCILDIRYPDRDGEWLDVTPAPTRWAPFPVPSPEEARPHA